MQGSIKGSGANSLVGEMDDSIPFITSRVLLYVSVQVNQFTRLLVGWQGGSRRPWTGEEDVWHNMQEIIKLTSCGQRSCQRGVRF